MRAALLLLLTLTGAAGQTHVSVRLFRQSPSGPQARTVRLPLEEYVAGVVAGEAGAFRSEEALKAVAVAARTYAVRFRGRHAREGFDFCETTHCQDLRLEAVTERVRRAVEETEGEMVWHEGSPAATYHHRHCGGVTEAAADPWPGEAAPYLRRQADTYCTARGRDDWKAFIGAADLRAALRQAGLAVPSRIETLEVEDRSPTGRAKRILLDGRPLAAELLHLAVGRGLGWGLLRSANYQVIRGGDGFRFWGYGDGHGVGLCQVGAENRGLAGHSYRQILAFYYPGTATGVTAAGLAWRLMGGERVDVLSTRPAADAPLAALADRLLAEAERRSGLQSRARPRVRIYPTLDAYRNATGEPGWAAASTRGGTVRLQPPAKLRGGEGPAPVLLHEFLHLLIEERAAASLPWWFLEGLALHLAEPPRPATASGRLAGAPRNLEEARRAYEIARSRVKRLDDEHGRPAILRWLVEGLPPPVAGRFAADAPDGGGQR